MAITDELREYARHLHNVWYDPRSNAYTYTTMDIAPSLDAVRLDEHVLAIADRIDAEHESKVAETRNDALYHANEKDMAELGWIHLPKDADGEYIHIGDVMEWVRYEDDDPTIVRKVSAVGAGVFFAWSDERCRYAQYDAQAYRHHKQPTVEDVLCEMLCAWEDTPTSEGVDGIIAKYAAKLQLKEQS